MLHVGDLPVRGGYEPHGDSLRDLHQHDFGYPRPPVDGTWYLHVQAIGTRQATRAG